MLCDAFFKYAIMFSHVFKIKHPKNGMQPHNLGALLSGLELKLHTHPQVPWLWAGECLVVL